MGYILYHIKSSRKIKWYASLKGAKIGMTTSNKNAGYKSYEILEENEFEEKFNPWTTTTSLMTGKPVDIRKQDLGTCVDPGTERFWSM